MMALPVALRLASKSESSSADIFRSFGFRAAGDHSIETLD